MVKTKDEVNSILGTTQLTIQIRNLETLDEIGKRLLETDGLAEKIYSIDIKTDFTEEEEEEEKSKDNTDSAANNKKDEATSNQVDDTPKTQKEETKPGPTREERIAAWEKATEEGTILAARLCAPLAQILTTISSRGGSLKHFSWCPSYYGGTCFNRPAAFWEALFAHSKTLESMRLEYFEHELDLVPAPNTTFPALKKLILDTSGAHGDDGKGVDALLKSCPNLSTLDFIWPGCDLDDCQIQNISWEYKFPNLTRLELSGFNFASAKLATFLSQHPDIETLYDGVTFEEGHESEPAPLKPDILPKLNVLYKRRESNFAQYFNEEAWRPIRHLALDQTFGVANALSELAKLPRAKKILRVLELEGDIRNWREEEDDSSSDEEEEGNEDEEKNDGDGEKGLQKEKEKRESKSSEERENIKDDAGSDEEKDAQTPYQPPPRTPDVVKEVLANFEALQELGISLESDNIYYRRPDGIFGTPDPATSEDLKYVLTYIPSTTRIRALRLWDPKGESLLKDVLDDFPQVPDSLEYLAWEGKVKTLYKLVREDGKVKAVVERVYGERGEDGDGEEGKDWAKRRILDC